MKKRFRTLMILMFSGILFLVNGTFIHAQDLVQPPSAFTIEADGIFTTGDEWSDVTPLTRLSGLSFVYTATDPDQMCLYLMYDLTSSNVSIDPGEIAGSVHFHNGGSDFEVNFVV
ncbi:MAG: hypothetical protein IH946_01730, partial [Bacteroidetes bacterium]|nr:hypothetical protein [Bacteroidota bacterium]